MQLYFLQDGDIYAAKEFEDRLSSHRYVVTGTDGKEYAVRTHLSYPKLGCVRFHTEAMPEILKLLAPYKVDLHMPAMMAMLRKGLGLKRLRQFVMPDPRLLHRFVTVQVVGWRRDNYDRNGAELV